VRERERERERRTERDPTQSDATRRAHLHREPRAHAVERRARDLGAARAVDEAAAAAAAALGRAAAQPR
jgi:hypothetical protein